MAAMRVSVGVFIFTLTCIPARRASPKLGFVVRLWPPHPPAGFCLEEWNLPPTGINRIGAGRGAGTGGGSGDLIWPAESTVLLRDKVEKGLGCADLIS